eukprot:TRINITY_DN12101_c0_g2_i1.p1 TRINITY_DN12101_c0_g2~~TRINITY_DN12101_c0_g2_i1.p1  ORF type:complete len:887 (-),score=196.60 TRINITY_DN12101_c0_g2_i1:41-2587(-)
MALPEIVGPGGSDAQDVRPGSKSSSSVPMAVVLPKSASMPAFGSSRAACRTPSRFSPKHVRLHLDSIGSATPGLSSYRSSIFTPHSTCTSSCSPEAKRPGSGRFYSVELSCFRRVPCPSPFFGQVGGAREFFSPQSNVDDNTSDDGSPSHKTPVVNPPLPLEEPTERILETIYSPGKGVNWGMSQTKNPRKAGRAGQDGSRQNASKFASNSFDRGVTPSGPQQKRTQMSPATGRQPQTSDGFLPQRKNTLVMESEKTGQSVDVAGKSRLNAFRQKLLEKFQTVRGAFESFASGSKQGFEQELTRKQFSRFLSEHLPNFRKEDHRDIFDFLDADGNGHISISEFHTAVEAASPATSIYELRKKWIALGHPVMRQALQLMGWSPDSKDNSKRLDLAAFSHAMARTGIEDTDEHTSLFVAIQERGDRSGTVTLEQVSAALAAVSPHMILEEIRDKSLRRCGSLDDALVQMNPTGMISRKTFCHYLVDKFGISIAESHRAFETMDVDNSGKLSRKELLLALRLSEPGFFLEDLRKKVRQRFRSIQEEALKLQEARKNGEETEVAEGDPGEGEYILRKVDLAETDVQLFLKQIDSDGKRKVSLSDLIEAVRLFTPSCVIEDLRLDLLLSSSSIGEAMFKIPQEFREAALDMKAFERAVRTVDSAGNSDVKYVFRCLECRRSGGVYLEELASALRSAGTGVQVPLTGEQRDVRARQQIRWQLAPFRRSAGDLRGELRAPVQAQRGMEVRPVGRSVEDVLEENEKLRQKETVLYPLARTSYLKVKAAMDQRESQKVRDGVQSYYTNASVRLAYDVPLIGDTQRKAGQYEEVKRHRVHLGNEAPALTCCEGVSNTR